MFNDDLSREGASATLLLNFDRSNADQFFYEFDSDVELDERRFFPWDQLTYRYNENSPYSNEASERRDTVPVVHGVFAPVTRDDGNNEDDRMFWRTFGLNTVVETVEISVREMRRAVALQPWLPDETDTLPDHWQRDPGFQRNLTANGRVSEIRSDGSVSEMCTPMMGVVDESRDALWVEKGDIHIFLPASDDFQISLIARPVTLPPKDEETRKAEAKEEQAKRNVVKVKLYLDEAEQFAQRWQARIERLRRRLDRAESMDPDVYVESDDDSELDDLFDDPRSLTVSDEESFSEEESSDDEPGYG